MLESYKKYQDITKCVLDGLRRYDDQAELVSLLQAREGLFFKFENAGWPDILEAEKIIKETLLLEKECVKILSDRREELKKEMNGLAVKRHVLARYGAQVW